MIKVNNFNISDIYYSGYTIIRAYGCGGEQVYNSYPVPYGTRYILYLNDDTTVTGSCTVNGQPYHQIDGNWVHSAETDRFNTDDDLSAVTSVALGECATALNIGAFSGFTNMSAITVSNNLVDIGQGAFSNCYSLQNFPYSESLEHIYDSAFYKCYSLTSVTIPSSVVSIGDGAFRECTGLTSVTMEATTPPTLGNYVFYDEFSQTKLPIKIYVPAESLNAYKTATNWSDYADRIYPIGYVPYDEQYLTIIAGADNFKVGSRDAHSNVFQYSVDDGATWSNLANGERTSAVNTGEKILFKASGLTVDNADGIGTLFPTNISIIQGNVMSLVYGDDFIGKTTIPNDRQFLGLFYNSSATGSPQKYADNLILPATTLTKYCYRAMFGNGNLITAPELPATTLEEGCYYNMFYNCKSLTTAPELSATTMSVLCYRGMFNGCTSLLAAPVLPATTLADSCYDGMFQYCTSLTAAPELPATTLAGWCYSNMFNGCTSLVTAPELPAETLSGGCYQYMFQGCTSLTVAPVLSATTLTPTCYRQMFSGCTSLNYIKCLATDISANSCTSNWVNGVAASGTFVKASSMNDWTTGNNGIPSGWTVQDDSGDLPYNQQYLTFVASSDNMSVGLSYANANVYQYSIDSGSTWSSLTNNQSTSAVNSGETILFKASGLTPTTNEGVGTLRPSTYAKVQGNVMSLVYGDNFVGQTTISNQNQFKLLFFEGGTYLTDASNLIMPATTLANDCYRSMFYGCSGLTAAPELPATTLSDRCYYNMFGNCTSLTTAPDLPATTMVDNCYNAMFMGCTSLNYVKCLANTNSVLYTYQWLLNASASGTFVKAASMSSDWQCGESGIPNGWSVEDENGFLEPNPCDGGGDDWGDQD